MRGPGSGLRGRGGEGVQTPARLTLAGGSDLFLTHPLLKAKSNHPRKMACQETWRRFRAPRGHSADPSPAAPLQRTCKTAVKFPAGPGGRVGLEPEREGALQPGNVPTDTQPPVNTGEARLHAPLRKTKGCRTLGSGARRGELTRQTTRCAQVGLVAGPVQCSHFLLSKTIHGAEGKEAENRPPPGPVLTRATGGRRRPASPEPAALPTGSPPGTYGHSRFGASTSPQWACNMLSRRCPPQVLLPLQLDLARIKRFFLADFKTGPASPPGLAATTPRSGSKSAPGP